MLYINTIVTLIYHIASGLIATYSCEYRHTTEPQKIFVLIFFFSLLLILRKLIFHNKVQVCLTLLVWIILDLISLLVWIILETRLISHPILHILMLVIVSSKHFFTNFFRWLNTHIGQQIVNLGVKLVYVVLLLLVCIAPSIKIWGAQIKIAPR